MDRGPLVNEEINAGAELVREFDKFEPVKGAFWLKADDEEQRYLYIASDRIDGTNIDVAYGAILRLTKRIRSPYLDPFRVKLINAKDPLAKAATDINSRFPNRIAGRFAAGSFGGLSVDDAYIYSPIPVAVS
ncbi:MAG: hypothetical protein EXS16_10205 [Gemmataceae bacterium]|nr:hypothetical protein [Gemmataceae bacterium]